jgi:hypothetical protein
MALAIPLGMTATRSEASSTCRLNTERRDARAKLEQELRDTAKTIADTLPEVPDRAVGPLFADLFAALPGVDAPALLRDAAKGVEKAREDPDARQTFFALGVKLWTRLAEADAMEGDRARVLAERLAPCAELPAFLFFLERDAADHGLANAEAVFARELDRRFPAFRRGRGHAAIDRPLLGALGATPESHARLQLELHPNGHLASLRVPGDDGPSLTLSPGGGAGHFVHTGQQGGYGFHIDERYAKGQVHATLNSPWHDGSESSETKEWVCWVLECIGSIVSAAERAPPKKRKR